MKNPTIKNKCSTIGKQLSRTNQSVWRRMKILQRKHYVAVNKPPPKKSKLVNKDSSLKKEKKKKVNKLN